MEKLEITKEELKSLVGEAAKAEAKGQVDAMVASLGLEKVGKRFAALGEVDGEKLASLGAKEKIAAFIKAVHGKDMGALAAFKAMNEGTNSAGGFLVPEEWLAEVNRIVEDFGLVGAMARRIPMNTDTLHVPVLGASVSVGYVGETVAGTPSQPVLAEVELLVKTLIGITPMSNELLADANISVVDLLTELFAEQIAGTMDAQALTGTGAPFTGILNAVGVNEVTAIAGDDTFAEVLAKPDYLREMSVSIKPWAAQGAGYVMHRTVWNEIQKAKASGSGEYLLSTDISQNVANAQGFPVRPTGMLFNFPVWLSDKMPAMADSAADTAFVVFGNLRNVYVGDRAQMAVMVSEHATVGADNLFAQNMSAVRITARHAIAVGLPAAFARLLTNAV